MTKSFLSNAWFKIQVSLIRTFGFIIEQTFIRFAYPRPSAFHSIPLTASHSLQCAIYYPKTKHEQNSQLVYVNLHGGGFIAGYCTSDSEYCQFIADQLQCIVVSSNYRLAPEYPYPTGLNDCVEAVRWVKKKYQPNKIILGGFSAGGTLALGAAQVLHNESEPVDAVVTFYCPMDLSAKSQHKFPEKNPLIRNVFHEAYLLNADPNDLENPILSPAHAPASSLPDSLIIIAAEEDPNSVDIQNFVDRMKREKSNKTFVEKLCIGVFHGWNLVPECLLGKERTRTKWEAYHLVADELKCVFQI
jgi:acetyl esterase/lipase